MSTSKEAACRLSPVSKRRRDWLLAVALTAAVMLVVLIVHWPALSAKTHSFDDSQYLTQNPLVQHPSWKNAWRFLSEVLEPSTVHGYYQPLAMISLMADTALGGSRDNLTPYHRTSLVLHVINTALVTALLYALFGELWPAVLAGLLFGVHPMTVEPIPWTGERKTVLATMFALASLLAYVRYARRGGTGWYVVCAVLFVLALMSKPTTTPLPAVMLLLDVWPLRRFGRTAIIEKLPLFGIAGASAVITVISQDRTADARPPEKQGFANILFMLAHNIIFYLYKMLWPVRLSSHYPIPDPLSLKHPMVRAGVIGTIVLFVVLLSSLRWTRALVVGWLIFFVAIFPTMGVIGFTNVIASDKFLYLPCIGFLCILTWALTHLWRWARGRAGGAWIHAATVALVLLVAGAEAHATRTQLARWTDTETYFRYMISLAPNASSLYDTLGAALAADGRIDEAVPLIERAIKLKPDAPKAHYNMAQLHRRRGRLRDAIAEYRATVALDPTHVAAYSNLSACYLVLGETDQAIACARAALDRQPDYRAARLNLIDALVRSGRKDEAVAQLDILLQENPNDAAARRKLSALRSQ